MPVRTNKNVQKGNYKTMEMRMEMIKAFFHRSKFSEEQLDYISFCVPNNANNIIRWRDQIKRPD
jgi:hypothetical protein